MRAFAFVASILLLINTLAFCEKCKRFANKRKCDRIVNVGRRRPQTTTTTTTTATQRAPTASVGIAPSRPPTPSDPLPTPSLTDGRFYNKKTCSNLYTHCLSVKQVLRHNNSTIRNSNYVQQIENLSHFSENHKK